MNFFDKDSKSEIKMGGGGVFFLTKNSIMQYLHVTAVPSTTRGYYSHWVRERRQVENLAIIWNLSKK